MTTPIQIRLAYKRGRYWFRIGDALVRTYPSARRLAEGV